MYIAVLIYGRLDKCVEHHDNIVYSLGKNNHIDFFLSSDNSSESQLSNFISLYDPILYDNTSIHYDYDLGKYGGKRDETNIHNMTCHFINKKRVFTLMEKHITRSNIQYDCVVSLRTDCVFKNNFDFTSLLNNTIYIPFGYDYINNAINDQIAYGKIDVMKKYNFIDAIDLLERKLSIPHPESLNYANIHSHKLNIVRPILKYHREI